MLSRSLAATLPSDRRLLRVRTLSLQTKPPARCLPACVSLLPAAVARRWVVLKGPGLSAFKLINGNPATGMQRGPLKLSVDLGKEDTATCAPPEKYDGLHVFGLKPGRGIPRCFLQAESAESLARWRQAIEGCMRLAQSAVSVTLTIPQSVRQGQQLAVRFRDGQIRRVNVPAGIRPGRQLSVRMFQPAGAAAGGGGGGGGAEQGAAADQRSGNGPRARFEVSVWLFLLLPVDFLLNFFGFFFSFFAPNLCVFTFFSSFSSFFFSFFCFCLPTHASCCVRLCSTRSTVSSRSRSASARSQPRCSTQREVRAPTFYRRNISSFACRRIII
jgi:hypothetical protein